MCGRMQHRAAATEFFQRAVEVSLGVQGVGMRVEGRFQERGFRGDNSWKGEGFRVEVGDEECGMRE